MRFAIFACGLLCLAGCARDEAAFPSLSPRAAEGRNFAEPAVPPPPVLAPDPVLDARIAEWSRRLDMIVSRFDRDAAQATRATAATGARSVGSEGWLSAQSALAALDDWRGQASGLAAEVDDAARERAATVGTPYPALEALRTRSEGEGTRIAERAASIAAALPTP